MVKRVLVEIPHGILYNGSWLRKAQIRELNGFDEVFLSETNNLQIPIRTTKLLKRVVKFDNVNESEIEQVITNLLVGDRIALTLHLRRLSFGNFIYCVSFCTNCKKEMKLELNIDYLLQPVKNNPTSEYKVEVRKYSLILRPINGEDLHKILRHNEVGKPEKLLRSCVISSKPPLPKKIKPILFDKISSKLKELDPQANLILKLSCPICGNAFDIEFNVEEFFYSEIEIRQRELLQEIHLLALNYHWSQDEILSLTAQERRKFIDLVNRTLSGEKPLKKIVIQRSIIKSTAPEKSEKTISPTSIPEVLPLNQNYSRCRLNSSRIIEDGNYVKIKIAKKDHCSILSLNNYLKQKEGNSNE